MSKLFIELIPQSQFKKNVRALLTKAQWKILRDQVCSEVYNICQICDIAFPSLHCHEIWLFDDKKSIQKLDGMIALCESCHMCIHFGLAQLQGKEELAIKHLMKINLWNKKETIAHIKKSFLIWQERSKKVWKLDMSRLKEYGIDISKLEI